MYKIVIADDDSEDLNFASYALRNQGYVVFRASENSKICLLFFSPH